MPALSSFDYAVIRVVPRVERGEFVNAGIILFSRTLRFLAARVALDRARVRSLAPGVDLQEMEDHLACIPLICAGDPKGGTVASWPQAARFHWLVAPRSTVIQVSPVHSGLTADPASTLEELMERLVQPVERPPAP